MEPIRKTIKQKNINSYTVDDTVNSKDKSLTTVNSITVTDKIAKLIEDEGIAPEGVAQMLAEILDDIKSLDYYKILSKETSHAILLETAHYVKDMDRQGKIRTNKAIYFQAILRKKGIRTRFKKRVDK